MVFMTDGEANMYSLLDGKLFEGSGNAPSTDSYGSNPVLYAKKMTKDLMINLG